MKITNWAEKIGFALLVIGLLGMLISMLNFEGMVAQITEDYELFFWSGYAIWVLGYGKSEADRKKEN